MNIRPANSPIDSQSTTRPAPDVGKDRCGTTPSTLRSDAFVRGDAPGWRPTGTRTAPAPWCAGATSDITNVSTDGAFRIAPRGNSVEIDVGIGGPIVASGGQVGLQIAGRNFVVASRPGQAANEVLGALRAQIEASGLYVSVENLPTLDTLRQRWSFYCGDPAA